jgi:hypothetical protein
MKVWRHLHLVPMIFIPSQVFRRQQRQRGHTFSGSASDADLADRLRLLQSILGDPTNNLHVTLSFVRQHLPALLNGMDAESGAATDTPMDDDDEDFQSLELLVSLFYITSLYDMCMFSSSDSTIGGEYSYRAVTGNCGSCYPRSPRCRGKSASTCREPRNSTHCFNTT